MSGAFITLDARGLAGADAALGRLDPLNALQLMNGLARLIQQQTRRRIEEEKSAPGGAKWKPNRQGTSILYKEGRLSASIDYFATAAQVTVGSGLVYARIHQDGGEIRPKNARALVFQAGNQLVFAGKVTIPARPYLGVSADNARDILEATVAFIRKVLG